MLGADGSRNGEPVAAGGVAEIGGPADQVVGEDDAGEPGAVRREMPGGDVGEAGSFFEVTDREFDDGVAAVLGVDDDGRFAAVGDEGVVTPVGEQGGLVAGESGAANDQTHRYRWKAVMAASGEIRTRRDFAFAAVGVDDWDPGGVWDLFDAGTDRRVETHCD